MKEYAGQSGIYKITKKNGEVYVGKAKDLYKRLSDSRHLHMKDAEKIEMTTIDTSKLADKKSKSRGLSVVEQDKIIEAKESGEALANVIPALGTKKHQAYKDAYKVDVKETKVISRDE